MTLRPIWSLVAIAALLAAPPCLAEAPAAGKEATFEKDTPGQATPGGVTFTVPAGWRTRTSANMVVLAPPEDDFEIAIVDVDAKDADAAAAAGWTAFRPGFDRPLRIAQPQAPRDGWEERKAYDYETSPNEKLALGAYAWRAGKAWTVIAVQGSQATSEKRGGPIGLAIGSLRPKGYSKESFAGKKAHALDKERIETLRTFVAEGMKRLDTPGVGFSLIDGGKIAWVGGAGVRELGKPEPVDADTLFIAASNTKALTTLLLAELVDEKKLGWDQPAVEAYPKFKLGDAETTKGVLVKHLICACTGMPRQDLEWLFQFQDATPAYSLELLATMQPTSKFGEVFQYSNLMATAAGFIGGAIAVPGKEVGAAYDQAMQEKVFAPLGMKRTTFDFKQAMQGNYARPHDVDVDGKPVVGSMALNYTVVPARPAGGVWTSARDLSQYVVMELANGKLPNGKRLVSEQNLLARRTPNVVVGADVDYGMGLIVDKRWGVTIVHHGGDLAGYHSDMMWLPEYGVGAVILTNSDPGYALRGPFLRKLVEVLFDGKPEADAALKVAAQQIEADRKKTRERLQIPPDTAASAKLAAHYKSATLGDVRIARKDGALVFDIGEWASPVASRKNDDGTVSFITIGPTLQGFEFVVGEKDGKRTLIVRDAQHEYVFDEA